MGRWLLASCPQPRLPRAGTKHHLGVLDAQTQPHSCFHRARGTIPGRELPVVSHLTDDEGHVLVVGHVMAQQHRPSQPLLEPTEQKKESQDLMGTWPRRSSHSSSRVPYLQGLLEKG